MLCIFRYKSTYDQFSGVTTLTILNLNTQDEGEYTCTALNSKGEVSTSALLLGLGEYRVYTSDVRMNKKEPIPVMCIIDTDQKHLYCYL